MRLRVLFLGFLTLFVLIAGRLFFWQVVRGNELADLARLQHQGGGYIAGQRGSILSSDGTWLVANKDVWLLYASPQKIDTDITDLSEKLARVLLGESYAVGEEDSLREVQRIAQLLSKKASVWVPIKHKLDENKKLEIESWDIDGLGFEHEEDREYPEGSVAAQLLGFVGKDENGKDKGYFGLEGYYDFLLSGSLDYQSRESDPRGIPLLLSKNIDSVSTADGGVDLVTTIDKTIQIKSERKLKEGIEKYSASGGSVVVMEPKTGALLAMSSFPSFDQSNYQDFGNEVFKNPVISSTFEPGSIMKVIVMASALDAGLIDPETRCPICDGPLKIGKYYIKTWNGKYRPESTMTEVIVESDNVGMVYVGSLLGQDKLYDYLTDFGIGQDTGIDLQGEVSAKLREKGSWSEIDLATASFGQGVAVTAMQMVKAVSTIANGGISVTPKVVDKIVSEGWQKVVEPTTPKRVISQKAALDIAAMMAEAAKHGESKWTYRSGYKIAGKTGTAQIPIEGHYDPEQTIASFIGFAPFDDPKFVMLVTLVAPQSSPWASETSAPLWYSIAQDIFDYYGIQPGQ